jgi:NAD(P)-dependent dehydrogenase (short-subunit alcohol dehydrogenase family)
MAANLPDKIIVLAGGADGIGHECALAYAREGATRFITGSILPMSGGAELGYRR